MPNMSYCRFELTYGDLYDCVDALQDGVPNSAEEQKFAKKIYDLCTEYIQAYEYTQELEEENEH